MTPWLCMRIRKWRAGSTQGDEPGLPVQPVVEPVGHLAVLASLQGPPDFVQRHLGSGHRGEKAGQLFAGGIVGAVRAVGYLALDAAGADGALAAIATMPAIETHAAIARDIGQGHVRRAVLYPPLG